MSTQETNFSLSSLTIAFFLDKSHTQIKKDIRRTIGEHYLREEFNEDENNRITSVYNLQKNEVLKLVSDYSIKKRYLMSKYLNSLEVVADDAKFKQEVEDGDLY